MTNPLMHDANTLEPQDLFKTNPIRLADLTPVFARLGKKTKRTYAWLHNALCAAVRQYVGRSPADIEKALFLRGAAEDVARRAALQWKESLAVRDSLESIARSQHPTDSELTGFEEEALNLFMLPENEPARLALRRLAGLLGAGMGCQTTRSLMDHLRGSVKPDACGLPHRAVYFGIRNACFAVDDGSRQEDRKIEASPCGPQASAASRPVVSEQFLGQRWTEEGRAIANIILSNLPLSSRLYFQEAISTLLASANAVIEKFSFTQKAAEVFGSLPVVQAHSHSCPSLSSLFFAFPYYILDEVSVAINEMVAPDCPPEVLVPRPETMEEQRACFAQMTDQFEAAAASAPQAEALYRRLLLYIDCLLALFDKLTVAELDEVKAGVPEDQQPHWEKHRLFLKMLSHYRPEELPQYSSELVPQVLLLVAGSTGTYPMPYHKP